jgi:hypothetical protein
MMLCIYPKSDKLQESPAAQPDEMEGTRRGRIE